jgi:hypothetical protein
MQWRSQPRGAPRGWLAWGWAFYYGLKWLVGSNNFFFLVASFGLDPMGSGQVAGWARIALVGAGPGPFRQVSWAIGPQSLLYRQACIALFGIS